MRRRHVVITRWRLGLAASVMSIALLAGCGGDSGDEATPAAPAATAEAPAATAEAPAATTQASEGGEGGLPNLDYVKSQIDKYMALPEFVAPGPAFDASKARGKTIVDIGLSSAIPFVLTIEEAMKEVAQEYGIEYQVCENQGQPSQWAQCIDQAIAAKADAINLLGANPLVLQPQVEAATRAGIAVVASHIFDVTQPPPPGVTAQMPAEFSTAARLEADWVIWDTEGQANVLIVGSDDLPPTKPIIEAMQAEYEEYCGDGCKTTVVNVPTTEWATKIQTEVQSALVRDPTINYVVPLYDSMSQFAVTGITAAGRANDVKIATFNGTPFVLQMMQDDDIVQMDVGESQKWLGWANMDLLMRILAGEEPVDTENTALRIFTDVNVEEAGVPPATDVGYGEAFIEGYRQLWGGAS
jgi:ribose transport system substrate-binding protein